MTSEKRWRVGELRAPAGVRWDRLIRDEVDDAPIAMVQEAGWGEGEARKHAYLIASAPDLYDALEACVAELEALDIAREADDEPMPLIAQARAALAKARGEQ
jgi:hypothetical protein